ncbi:MAG: RrF2 family transcriptional regulator [Planctomycetia bacterium]|nr:MAG: RrF2 family transcriptional regulator [Planctomycetia bacterium]
MLSPTVEYSLRAIVTLAQHAGGPCTAERIAALTHVPRPYLSKLMHAFVRAGMVRSQRGPRGGFVLTRPASELTIWDVVEVIDPIKRIRECPLGIDSHGCTLCPLHRRLDHALELVEQSLRDTSLAEVLKEPGSPTPLCEVGDAARGPAPMYDEPEVIPIRSRPLEESPPSGPDD